jgi:hypothetical protein
MRLLGNGNVEQEFTINGPAGDDFMLTFDAKSTSVSGSGNYRIRIYLFCNDGSKQVFTINQPVDTNPWTSYDLPFSAAKGYNKIRIQIQFSKARGTIWYDNIVITRN